MKRLILFFATLFLVINVGCRKDNEDNLTNVTIVGTWKPVKVKVSGSYQGLPLNQEVALNTCQQQTRVVYKSDGNGTETSWDDASGTCTNNGTKNFTYSYNPSSKELVMTQNGTDVKSTVSTLNATEMSIKGTQDYNGFTYNYEAFFQKVQ